MAKIRDLAACPSCGRIHTVEIELPAHVAAVPAGDAEPGESGTGGQTETAAPGAGGNTSAE